jgi:metallophosphoesterase superfamily enzyme
MATRADWLLTAARVAVHLPTATAVVADLHLGYTEARRRAGDAVPIRSVAELLQPLADTMREHEAPRLAIAGDLFEAGVNDAVLAEFLAWVEATRAELLAVVPGNHDRGWKRLRDVLPIREEGFRLGEWLIVHGDGELPDGPLVLGHWHPALRWGRVTAPCFLLRDDRLILPAYCREAAGVNVLAEETWRDYDCHAIAGAEVLDFGCVVRLATTWERRRAMRRVE